MSAATDWLQHKHQRRAWVLEVAGLEYRYTSHPGITAGSPGGLDAYVEDTASGLAFTDVLAITDLSNAGAEIDVSGGVAEYDPITITLATQGHRAEAGDPGTIFGRVGPRAGGAVTQLTDTAGQVDTRLEVTSSAGFSVPGLYHLGGESLWVTNIHDATHIDVTRGAGRTVPQVHTSNTDTGDVPVLYDRIVHWRTRRARLLCCGLDERGQRVTDFVEVMRGFIDETPRISGNAVSVVLAPLTALLDVPLAAPQKPTRLVNGFHFFSPPYACTLVHGQEVVVPSLRLDGAAVAGPPREWPCEDPGLDAWESTFDPNGLGTAYPGHPRIGFVDGDGTQPEDWIGGTAPSGGGTGIEGDGLSATAAAGDEYPGDFGVVAREAISVNILDPDDAAAGLAWPAAAVDAINSATGWTPGAHTGLSGAWFDVALTLGRADGPGLSIRSNIDGADGRRTLAHLNFFEPAVRGWLVSDLVDPTAHEDWRTGEARPVPVPPDVLWFGVDFGGPSTDRDPEFGRRIRLDTTGSPLTWAPIGGVADGFHQQGEPFVLVEDDIPLPAGAEIRMRVDYHDPWADEERSASFRVTASNSVTVGGSVVGYRLTIHEADRWSVPSFGDWPGYPRARLTPVLQFDDTSPGELLLTILESAGGGGGETYDLQAFGVGLTSDDVDEGSFFAIAPPQGQEAWTFRAEEGASARDIIDPILKAWGCGLAMRRDATGACKLRLVPMGYEVAANALANLDNDDLALRPTWATDERIVNRFVFNLDWDLARDEHRRTVQVNDTASQNAYRETEAEEYDLRGLRLLDGAGAGGDANQLLRPVYGRFKALLGHPRRTWEVRVGNGPGLFAELGAVYTITSDFLRGYGDTIGVTAAAGRVTRVDLGTKTEPTTILLTHYGANATGWNASAKVKTVVSTTVVEVEQNEYSATTDPATGAEQRDVDGFAAGEAVLGGSPADSDAAASLTISTVTRSTNRITFTGAHGLSVGDVIWPPAYGSASDAHKALAYLAGTDGLIVAADGFDYA